MSHAVVSKRAAEAVASLRPEGYIDLLRRLAAQETATHFLIPRDSYAALCAQFRSWPSAPLPPAHAGPGSELKALLASIGIRPAPTCKCNKMASQMDAWGPDESERRTEEIVDVMHQEAAARKLPFLRAVGRKLVRIACQRARLKSRRTGH